MSAMPLEALNDDSSYTRIDASSMREHLLFLPAQCRQAWREALAFPLPDHYRGVDKVLFLGMGGSAIGGGMAAALLAGKCRAALHSHRDYGLPGFVDSSTLVIAASYSGTTEETLDAFEKALALGCKKLAITTGGTLGRMAAERDVPVFPIRYESPPRAALGYGLMPLLAILHNLGLAPDLSADVSETISLLEDLGRGYAPQTPAGQNVAKRLAGALVNRLLVIYGAGILSPVAYRWMTQINENAKSWAVCNTVPELCHNSVAGLAHPETVRETAQVVLLDASSLHPRHRARYRALKELLDQSAVPCTVVDAGGRSELAQMMGLTLLGDWTSYYLAILNGFDPTPIPAIEHLKRHLKMS